jgi:hypothetical protein
MVDTHEAPTPPSCLRCAASRISLPNEARCCDARAPAHEKPAPWSGLRPRRVRYRTKAGQLFELDLDDAHRRPAWIGHLVRHVRLAKSNAAALEPRGLGGLPRLGEGEGAGSQDDADMRQVVRVHTSVHDAGRKRHISNTYAFIFEYDFDWVLRSLGVTVGDDGSSAQHDRHEHRAGRRAREKRRSPCVHTSSPAGSYIRRARAMVELAGFVAIEFAAAQRHFAEAHALWRLDFPPLALDPGILACAMLGLGERDVAADIGGLLTLW